MKEVEKCNEYGEEGKIDSESKIKIFSFFISISFKSVKDLIIIIIEIDFWDFLIKLDSLNVNRKGKSV